MLERCVSAQDIIDLGSYGFFTTIESKRMAWDYYVQLFEYEPSKLIPEDAVEFFGLDMMDDDYVNNGVDESSVMDVDFDSDDDVAMEIDVEQWINDHRVDIRVQQWMKDHNIPMMYGAGKTHDFEIVSERVKSILITPYMDVKLPSSHWLLQFVIRNNT